MKNSVFLGITPLKVKWRFGGSCRLHLQGRVTVKQAVSSDYSSTLKMEATCSSQKSVNFRQTARHYVPEDWTFYNGIVSLHAIIVCSQFNSESCVPLISSIPYHRMHVIYLRFLRIRKHKAMFETLLLYRSTKGLWAWRGVSPARLPVDVNNLQ
jgi:hypothetical protein